MPGGQSANGSTPQGRVWCPERCGRPSPPCASVPRSPRFQQEGLRTAGARPGTPFPAAERGAHGVLTPRSLLPQEPALTPRLRFLPSSSGFGERRAPSFALIRLGFGLVVSVPSHSLALCPVKKRTPSPTWSSRGRPITKMAGRRVGGTSTVLEVKCKAVIRGTEVPVTERPEIRLCVFASAS